MEKPPYQGLPVNSYIDPLVCYQECKDHSNYDITCFYCQVHGYPIHDEDDYIYRPSRPVSIKRIYNNPVKPVVIVQTRGKLPDNHPYSY